jgi:HEPN domain-containing protein
MEAAARDWAKPFLKQAKADLAAAEFVANGCAHLHPSTLCMLLQMVFEKLAKAAIAQGGTKPPKQHPVLSKFLPSLKASPSLPASFTAEVEAFILQLESATPAVVKGHGERLEYPWEDAAGRVYWPARDLTLAKTVANPSDLTAVACLKCAHDLANDLFRIFP